MKLPIALVATVALLGLPAAAHAQAVTNPADHPAPVTVTIDGRAYSDGLDTLPGYDDEACTPIPNIDYDFDSNTINYYDNDGTLLKTARWTEWDRISSYAAWKAQHTAKPTATATPTATSQATSTPTTTSNTTNSTATTNTPTTNTAANNTASSTTTPATTKSPTLSTSTGSTTTSSHTTKSSATTKSSTTNHSASTAGSSTSGSATTGWAQGRSRS